MQRFAARHSHWRVAYLMDGEQFFKTMQQIVFECVLASNRQVCTNRTRALNLLGPITLIPNVILGAR